MVLWDRCESLLMLLPFCFGETSMLFFSYKKAVWSLDIQGCLVAFAVVGAFVTYRFFKLSP